MGKQIVLSTFVLKTSSLLYYQQTGCLSFLAHRIQQYQFRSIFLGCYNPHFTPYD